MSTAAFDLDELVERLGGDRACARELVDIFLDDTRPRLASLIAPIGDLEGARRVAHTLKGACGNMAAHAASQAAAILEAAAAAGDGAAAEGARQILVGELQRLFSVLEREAGGTPPPPVPAGS